MQGSPGRSLSHIGVPHGTSSACIGGHEEHERSYQSQARGATYYCRGRIPQHLLGHEGGKKELAVSLRTHSSFPAWLARGDTRRAAYLAHLTLKNHGITLPKDSP